MKKNTLIIIFLFAALHSYSQNANSVWIFGDSAGISFANISNPIPITSSMDGRGSCASYADSNGNTKLYAATLGYLNNDWATRVFNSQHQILQGCDSITGAAWYSEVVIVPRPNHTEQFYVFSVGLDEPNNNGCFYTLVDMSLNSGAGSVVLQNIQINNAKSADCLTAVKHGNGRDWWVINKYSKCCTYHYNRFYKYLVTPDSVYPPVIQDFNDMYDIDFQKIIWNSTSDKFMQITGKGYMSEFGFDRCSGNITLIRNIYPEQTSNYNRRFWEGAYSPNDSVFYISTVGPFKSDTLYLLQYDLAAINITASCDTLGIFNFPLQLGQLRLAPDHKIYFGIHYDCNASPSCYPYPDSVYNQYNMNLSVINQPDSLGAACDFQPFSFYLGGKRTYYGLPNNPNYSLGKLVGSPCDTIQYAGITTPPTKGGAAALQTTYISQWQKLFVNAQNIKGKNCVLKIFDVNGRVVKSINKISQPPYFTQDVALSNLASGLYLVSLITEKEMLSAKFIKD